MAVSKRQMKALAVVHFDLFQPAVVDDVSVLPSEAEVVAGRADKVLLPPVSGLYRMYDRFNQEYFDNRLPVAKISYSSRMLIAGSYMPGKNEIKIGRKYHEIFPDEVADTLKHEMLHIVIPSHNSRFKAAAARIGASLKAKSHPSLRGNYKYLYVCPSCGREYPRRKRLRKAYCGICTKRGQFDDRFKLKLLKPKKV